MSLTLENLCQGFQQPSILDIKVGYATTYAWASDSYNAKNRCVVPCLPIFILLKV